MYSNASVRLPQSSIESTLTPPDQEFLNLPQEDKKPITLTKPDALHLAENGESAKAERCQLCGTRGHIRYCSGPLQHALRWEGHGCGLRTCLVCKSTVARLRFEGWEERLHDISNYPGQLLLVQVRERQSKRHNPLKEVKHNLTSVFCERDMMTPPYMTNLVGWDGDYVYYNLLILDFEANRKVDRGVVHETFDHQSPMIWDWHVFLDAEVKLTVFDMRNYKDVVVAFKRLVLPIHDIHDPIERAEQELMLGTNHIFSARGISKSHPIEMVPQEKLYEEPELLVGDGSITNNSESSSQVEEDKGTTLEKEACHCPQCGHPCNVIGTEIEIGSPEYHLLRKKLPRHVF